MSSEEISSKTHPIMGVGKSDCMTLLPAKPDEVAKNSRRDLRELWNSSDNLCFNKQYSDGHQQSIDAELCLELQDREKSDATSDHTDHADLATRYRSFVEQQLARLLHIERRRVNLGASISKQISCMEERLKSLSAQESNVLILMIQGNTCKEVAMKMNMKRAAAAKHSGNVLKKLEVRNRVELVHLLGALSFRKAWS